MKRFLTMLCFALVILLITPCAFAQNSENHVELGLYGEYFRWGAGGNANLLGLGGRAGVNVAPNVQLEADLTYDFQRAFASASNTGGSVGFSNSNVKRFDGLFGFKLQTKGPVRLFALFQGGATHFALSPRGTTFGSFTGTIGSLNENNLVAEFYPGGGVEAFIGPIGLRLDVGDEIYFVGNGGHNNLRVTFGPSIRF